MKRVVSIVMAAALACALAGCSIAAADSNVPDAGSAATEHADAADDGIDLACDNPLADAEIESVMLKLTGVADVELAELDAKAIADIVQSDERKLVDRSDWFIDSLDWLISEYPPHFFLKLATGEELTVSTNVSLGSSSGSLVILKPDHETYEYYELSQEEYDTFVTTYKNVSLIAIDSVPVTVKPFEDLTADQLVKVTRTNDWNDYSGAEHTLSEAQIESLVQTLNKLEIQPATIDQDPSDLYGGTYKDFELWFENGERIAVGEYHNASKFDENGKMTGEFYSIAWIDGATFDCDQESADELYWDYQEWSPSYKKQYLNTRDASDYPFERLTVGEVRAIMVGPNDAYSAIGNYASIDLAEEVVDVLRQLKISESNKVEGQPTSANRAQQDWGKEENQLLIELSNNEMFYLRTADGNILLNSVEYEQDDGVTQVYVRLYEDAVASAEELAGQIGDTQTLHFELENFITLPAQDMSGRYITYDREYEFKLPAELVEHEDGYYPEGYTLETAPLAVVVTTFDEELTEAEGFTVSTSHRPDDAPTARLKHEMEAAGGAGYFDYYVNGASTIAKWGRGSGTTEIGIYYDGNYNMEFYIVGRDDYVITPEAVLMLVTSSHTDEFVAQD